MGKKSVAGRGPSRQQRTLRHGVHIELMMECLEEGLSQSQHDAFKKADNEYKAAMAKIRDANRREKEGTAIVITQTRHGMPLPPPLLSLSHALKQKQPDKPPEKPPEKPPARSYSPDLIFVGETPPPTKSAPVKKPTPPQAVRPQSQPQVQAQVTRIVTDRTAARQGDFPHFYQFVNVPPGSQGKQQQIISVMKPIAPAVPQQQQQNATRPVLNMQYITTNTNTVSNNKTAGVKHNEVMLGSQGAVKRGSEEDTGPAKKKKKPVETDESGNWVPLDEYYYSKKEGDPTYTEEKGEYRFKCWYCSKMLYNNVKAMMHLQGHIDSGRQHNLDLTDLTQCKHCYKQFDTPFEMQTHVEKVHMSNTNVLMCRICERDLDSRQALTTHMRQNHNACEMPYLCQLCNFRSSMYSDVVDHFKKKHDSSQNILCLYCLRVFKVKFVSQGWGQTQTYYGHLLKHQSKTSARKCHLCRLTFFNPVDVKAHKKKDHLPNHKGIQGTAIHTSPGQVMIKVPESGLHIKQQNLKSLNAPAVSKVLDFGGTRLPVLVNYLTCLECKTSMGTPDHFKKHIECSMCRFATSCSIAYANHMMGFHSGQMSSLNLNIPWERKMKCHLYCLCGYGSRYGNNIANHLVFCAKRTCYLQKPDIIPDDNISDEDVDPRHKPGASILDVLGLVKKRTVSTKEIVDKESTEMDKLNEIRRRTRENSPPPKSPPPSVRRKPRDVTPPPKSPMETQEENVPEELKGAQKWNTVKIKDTKQPSKASVFLGGVIDDVEESKESTKPSEEEESQSKKPDDMAEGGTEGAEECAMEVEDAENTESTAENAEYTDKSATSTGDNDKSTGDSAGSSESTNLGAELTSEKDGKSDEQNIEDSLLNLAEDETNDDGDSKLDDSVLDQQDDVTIATDELKEHDHDSKMEVSKTNSGETSELFSIQSHVEQSDNVSSDISNKDDVNTVDRDTSVDNAETVDDSVKPSVEMTGIEETEGSVNEQSEHEEQSEYQEQSEHEEQCEYQEQSEQEEQSEYQEQSERQEQSEDQSQKNVDKDKDEATRDGKSDGNDGEQTQNESKQVDNVTDDIDNMEPSQEESDKKGDNESSQDESGNKGGMESSQDKSGNKGDMESSQDESGNKGHMESSQDESDNKCDKESSQDESGNKGDKESSHEEVEEENSSGGDAVTKEEVNLTKQTEENKTNETERGDNSKVNNKNKPEDNVKITEEKDVSSNTTTTSTDDKKRSSIEKEYKRESKEHKYEERQEYEGHNKYHGGGAGRSNDSHRQDYQKSSEGHRHGDRSHDRDYYKDRDHHYRDRDQYRDGDRYHDRNYHGHHDDRNYNRHGGGYHSNQSYGSGRWDDRRDDYRNRYRDHDRYQRGGRGGGYGHRSNYR